MSGSNVAGMSGSNVAGMSGSNVAGMSGSNVAGARGSNGRGTSRSNGHGKSGSSNKPAYNRTTAHFGEGFVAAAMGMLNAISRTGGAATIDVAGQSFTIAADQLSAFAVGDYVVAGIVQPGAIAIVYHVGLPYVPGVSPVRVRGAVDSTDATTGKLSIGALTVDYNRQLSAEPTFLPKIGDVISALGVQPLSGSPLLVDSSGDGISIIVASAVGLAIAERR
jgi:hypothetical protein